MSEDWCVRDTTNPKEEKRKTLATMRKQRETIKNNETLNYILNNKLKPPKMNNLNNFFNDKEGNE